MLRTLLKYKFCKVEVINQYQQLRDLMSIPSIENHRRLKLSVQQLIQVSNVNWKFVHRLDQLQNEFHLDIDFGRLIKRLKESQLDWSKQKLIVDIMKKYYDCDEEYFQDVFKQLLQQQDLQYATLIGMLYIFLDKSEQFEKQFCNKIVQQLLAIENVELYDLTYAFKLIGQNYNQILSADDSEWMNDLVEDIQDRIITLLPSIGQKQFRELINILRLSQNVSEKMKNAIIKYFKSNSFLFPQNTLVELLHLSNAKIFDNDQFKQSILISLNFIRIKKMNENQFSHKYIVPQLTQIQQELLANLITLSGFQVDEDYFTNYNVGTYSKRRQDYDVIEANREQINNIVTEIFEHLNSNPNFSFIYKLYQLIATLDLKLEQLLTPLGQFIDKLLSNQIVNFEQLLQIINYFESANIYLPLNQESIGFKQFIIDCKSEPFNNDTLLFLQQLYSKTQSQELQVILEQRLSEKLPIQFFSRQIILQKAFKQEISEKLTKCYQTALIQYPNQHSTNYDKILFYKTVESSNSQNLLTTQIQQYYKQAKSFTENQRRQYSKSRLPHASQLETVIYNDINQHMPKKYKIIQHEFQLGSEIDFTIESPNMKKLYIQIHGKTHFYQGSKELNYLTFLENLKLSQLQYFAVINHHQMASDWYTDRKTAVDKLIKCIQQ